MGFKSWFSRRRNQGTPAQPGVPADYRTIKFGGDGATIDIPSHLVDEQQANGTVLVFPPGQTVVSLRLSLISFRAKDGSISPGRGVARVREQAEEAGQELIPFGRHRAFSQRKQFVEEGVPIEMDFWHIGADESTAIISLTTDVNARGEPVAVWFRQQVPRMLESIQFSERVEFIETGSGAFATRVTTIDPAPQRIEDFGISQRQWLEESLRRAERLATRYSVPTAAADLTPAVMDTIFARWLSDGDEQDRTSDAEVADALGAALGEHLIRSLGMRWVTVSDDDGVARAIRHEAALTMAFPVDSVRKRIESRETDFIVKVAAIVKSQIATAELAE